jgi:hypothetical protein
MLPHSPLPKLDLPPESVSGAGGNEALWNTKRGLGGMGWLASADGVMVSEFVMFAKSDELISRGVSRRKY